MTSKTLFALGLVAVLQASGALAEERTFVDPATGVEAVGKELHNARALAADYWTPERLLDAVPMDVILLDEPIPAPQTRAFDKPRAPFTIEPSEPTVEEPPAPSVLYEIFDSVDKAAFAADSLLARDEQQRSIPFTGTEIYDSYLQYPLFTIGKLFFKQGGQDFVCSGASVGSEHRRLIWTAGHCVAGGDGFTWSEEVIFVPAYRNGEAPLGVWHACGLYTTGGWFHSGDFAHDIGIIKACDRPDGQRLHDVIGALGARAYLSPVQHWNAFGYPAAAPFSGETLNTCQSSIGTSDDAFVPATLGIGCDMTGGSSGGPWILEFKRQGAPGNYLNGVNSYGYQNVPNVMFSPYFGDSAVSLWQYANTEGA